jgi:hypothetical protein
MSSRRTNKRSAENELTREVEEEDEQVARAQELSTISADLASAAAVADAVREEEEAFAFLSATNARGATSSSSSSSSFASSAAAAPRSAATPPAAATPKRSPWDKTKASGGRSVEVRTTSTLAPNSGGSRKQRVTRMYETLVRDADTHVLLAIFVSNAYDRAQFLNGTLDYLGGTDEARMVKFPMRLFYTNARNARLHVHIDDYYWVNDDDLRHMLHHHSTRLCCDANMIAINGIPYERTTARLCSARAHYRLISVDVKNPNGFVDMFADRFSSFPCESPACLRNHYPTYVAIGYDEDSHITEANACRLQALHDQFMAVVDGSDDQSNNAVFTVVTTTVDADDNMLEALVALSE